jgi:uncharacterized protein YndB with AHSA1/START domain
MKYNFTAEIETQINAPLNKVWDALTKPELIKIYFFGTNTITDWKVGHPIIFEGEWEGKKYSDKGTVLEYRENDQLKYDYWSSMSGTEDIPENYGIITYTVKADGDRTRFFIKQENIRDEQFKEHSVENWKKIMVDLKSLVEAGGN